MWTILLNEIEVKGIMLDIQMIFMVDYEILE